MCMPFWFLSYSSHFSFLTISMFFFLFCTLSLLITIWVTHFSIDIITWFLYFYPNPQFYSFWGFFFWGGATAHSLFSLYLFCLHSFLPLFLLVNTAKFKFPPIYLYLFAHYFCHSFMILFHYQNTPIEKMKINRP